MVIQGPPSEQNSKNFLRYKLEPENAQMGAQKVGRGTTNRILDLLYDSLRRSPALKVPSTSIGSYESYGE